jgi:hypothetical protein
MCLRYSRKVGKTIGKQSFYQQRRLWKLFQWLENPNCYWCGQAMKVEDHEEPDYCTIEHLLPSRNPLHEAGWSVTLAHRWCNEKRESMTFGAWTELMLQARETNQMPWRIKVLGPSRFDDASSGMETLPYGTASRAT